MPQSTDPRAYQGLQPAFRNQVERWIAAGGGSFWLPVGNGWRSNQRQQELRVINGCPDVWTAPANSCRIPTAIPGTSRHETGEAVDVAGDLERANALAGQFGLTRIPREAWHFQAIGGRASGTASGQQTDTQAGTSTSGAAQTPGPLAGPVDNPCLVSLPSVNVPNWLPFLPDEFGGQCLFYQSWGRAFLGSFCLATGVVTMLMGLMILSGKTAQQLPGVGLLLGGGKSAPTGAAARSAEMLNRPVRLYERTITSQFSPYEPPVTETTRATTRYVPAGAV